MVDMLEEPNNKRYLHKNKIDFQKKNNSIVSLLQYGRCEDTLYRTTPHISKCDNQSVGQSRAHLEKFEFFMTLHERGQISHQVCPCTTMHFVCNQANSR